ncbi:MAG: hypothetical protein KGQ36_01775 [Rickettsiales bacterium]|nr:hypothetical protein [Rickettsiales bacterium]
MIEKDPWLVTARDKNGNTALHHAVFGGDVNKIKYLCGEEFKTSSGDTFRIVERVDVNACNNYGNSALHTLSNKPEVSYDIIKFLVRKGAKLSNNKDGRSPSDIAKENGRHDLVYFFRSVHKKSKLSNKLGRIEEETAEDLLDNISKAESKQETLEGRPSEESQYSEVEEFRKSDSSSDIILEGVVESKQVDSPSPVTELREGVAVVDSENENYH